MGRYEYYGLRGIRRVFTNWCLIGKMEQLERQSDGSRLIFPLETDSKRKYSRWKPNNKSGCREQFPSAASIFLERHAVE